MTTPAAFHARHKGQPRDPAWSVKEFAYEFGVPLPKLMSMIANLNEGCPKPQFRHKNRRYSNSYYAVSEMRKWWETVKDRV